MKTYRVLFDATNVPVDLSAIVLTSMFIQLAAILSIAKGAQFESEA